PLHQQFGHDGYYNSIVIDPLDPLLSPDFRNRLSQAAQNLYNQASGTNPKREFRILHLHFLENNRVNVIAAYSGGGGTSETSNARAIWTYEFVMDGQGKGRFTFVEASLNGPGQISNFAPILADYLEKHEF